MSPHASSNVIDFTGRVLRTTDSLGRRLAIRSLVATQREQLKKIFGESWKNPRFAFPAEIFASVCAIDERIYKFPKDKAEFENLVDAVEVEGMEAAILALERTDVHINERAKWFVSWEPCRITAPFKLGDEDVS